MLIFNLTLFRDPFLENQFLKIDILKTTKGNLKKETRKFKLPSL